jgi:metal-dependent hydrolase (beta-lactamase superfamily II)
VTFNTPVQADTAAIDAGLAGVPLDQLRAIVSGHAHYDHFLDVPHVLEKAPGAIAYTNLTGHPSLITRYGIHSGRPKMIEFVGQLYREDQILALGHSFEQEMKITQVWPDTSKINATS